MYCPNCGLKIRDDSKFCPECGTRLISTPKTDPLIGHILSKRFKIIKPLGRGGMGAVYLARDQELSLGDKDIYIAVKTLPPEFTYDRRAIDDMRREVILARALTHENIVRIHDLAFDEELNIYYITMEYVEGKTLSELIYEKGHLSEEQAIIVLKHTLRALEYAKDKRIVHRDIKPSNIMIDFVNKKVKVMDFGIARVIADTQSRISKTVVAGTPVYMSPEQHIGVGVSYASDIYSLGITAYEMLTGSPPYTTGDIYYQKVNTPPRRIAGISDWLWGLIRMMLSPDEKKRPQADVLLDYLDKKETPEIEVEEEDEEEIGEVAEEIEEEEEEHEDLEEEKEEINKIKFEEVTKKSNPASKTGFIFSILGFIPAIGILFIILGIICSIVGCFRASKLGSGEVLGCFGIILLFFAVLCHIYLYGYFIYK